ncbi:MAG TPA: hypothetical protein VMP67_00280 [Candidatus Limnocylindria bacterium]|nr:hypothetical protein [Candidatus Limnocylindria bacterium]
MHDLPQVATRAELREPELTTLPSDTPSLPELFSFMAEAEMRFGTLRMRIVDRRLATDGDETETSEVWLRHPGYAKVVATRDAAPRDFDLWLTDGETVQTYDARTDLATRRRLPGPPVGSTDEALPLFARTYLPVTRLPSETLADTFVHPHGFCRNVLATGSVRWLGTALLVGDRESIVLRCDRPRTSHVLTDRPDHWLEVAVDRQTGLILLLAEHVGGRTTRHGEVVSLALDETIGDEVFRIHVSPDTRILY